MFRGDRLKILREEKKLTQQEFALIINTTSTSINRYEKNKREPDIETINKFANFFNVSTDYLLNNSNTKLIIDGLNDKETDIIKMFRELDNRDHIEIYELIKVKYERVLKIKNSSVSANGEKAATSDSA